MNFLGIRKGKFNPDRLSAGPDIEKAETQHYKNKGIAYRPLFPDGKRTENMFRLLANNAEPGLERSEPAQGRHAAECHGADDHTNDPVNHYGGDDGHHEIADQLIFGNFFNFLHAQVHEIHLVNSV